MSKQSAKLKEAAAAIGTPKSVVIAQPVVMSVALEIEGSADLIQNAMAQKAVEEMLRKHMGLSVQREKKKPREVIENAKILNTDGKICVPPGGIKKAMLTASTTLKGFKKTQLRTQLWIEGNSVPITFDELVPRMDIVRVGGMTKVPDVRFRPSFINWRARLVLQFSDMLSVQSVVDLLNRAGKVGLCEWRPEKDGTFGTFNVIRHIEDPKEIAEIREICAVPLVRPKIPDWALDMDIDPEVLSEAFSEITRQNPPPKADSSESAAE